MTSTTDVATAIVYNGRTGVEAFVEADLAHRALALTRHISESLTTIASPLAIVSGPPGLSMTYPTVFPIADSVPTSHYQDQYVNVYQT